MKPRGLWATTVAMAVLNLGGLVGIQWNHYGMVAAVVLLMALGYVVLWYYWQGRNWARILVMLTSMVAVLDLATIPASIPFCGSLRLPYRRRSCTRHLPPVLAQHERCPHLVQYVCETVVSATPVNNKNPK